jgi:hypothetical protein
MIDGVAPRAKINQQRERRYKSHFFKGLPLIKESNESNDINGSNDKIKVSWNSNKITPGTLFMEKLSNSLNKFKIELLDNKNTDFYAPKDIIISDSNEAGEGEHKMMKIISNKLDYKEVYSSALRKEFNQYLERVKLKENLLIKNVNRKYISFDAGNYSLYLLENKKYLQSIKQLIVATFYGGFKSYYLKKFISDFNNRLFNKRFSTR